MGRVERGALDCFWGPVSQAEGLLNLRGRAPLLVASYGGLVAGLEAPQLEVTNRVFGGEPWVECWTSDGPVERGRAGAIDFAHDGEALFGVAASDLGAGVEDGTYALFRRLLELVQETGYPELVRVWNYLPDINREERGLERYRSFNLGRARAFVEQYGLTAERHFCASSAVGTPGSELRVAFLAARHPGLHLENPRQVAAWRYPSRYGPVGPSFARATIGPPVLGSPLILSGTASVVGHETRHAGEPEAQLVETIANVDRLLAVAATAGSPRWRSGIAALQFLKVYLRRGEDCAAVRAALAERLPADLPVLYLEADICRADLLLEIEGVAFAML